MFVSEKIVKSEAQFDDEDDMLPFLIKVWGRVGKIAHFILPAKVLAKSRDHFVT